MKIGTEVEGRFKGLLTLFLDAQEAKVFFHRKSLKESCFNERGRNLIEKVRHIYISDHQNILRPDDDCILSWLGLGFVICLERTDVYAEEWPESVSLMLVLEDQDRGFWTLRGNDQIKFSRGLTVFTMTKHQMTPTVPDDFLGDVELELKD